MPFDSFTHFALFFNFYLDVKLDCFVHQLPKDIIEVSAAHIQIVLSVTQMQVSGVNKTEGLHYVLFLLSSTR